MAAVRLFWLLPSDLSGGSGLFWPGPDPDPARSELALWEAEADSWSGDELVMGPHPWLLASADLCRSIAAASLTGLRIGAVATVEFSPEWKRRAALGELQSLPPLPEFRIVVPVSTVEITDEQARCLGWDGSDFAYSLRCPGLLVSGRALETLQLHRLECCSVKPLQAEPEATQGS